MTNKEITFFIEEMEELGDFWTRDQVERVYGNESLQDALNDRKAVLSSFGKIISSVLNA